MSKFEVLSLFLAGMAALISIVAAFLAGKANNLNVKMFKRQGVIDLHMAWQGINEIDSENLITTDIVKGANALSLTASLWNHDVVEKSILYQSYWHPYKTLYDSLSNCDKLVPGKRQTCKSLITRDMTKAYKGMENADLDTVTTSNL